MAAIVHICPRYLPARGGVETFFARLSEALAADGHVVTVRTTDAATVRGFTSPREGRLTPSRETMHGVRVCRFPVRYVPAQRYVRTLAHGLPFGTRWNANTLRWTPWVPGLADLDATDRPALVHAAGLPYSSLLCAGVELAARARARLVMTPFTHLPPPGPSGSRMHAAYLSRLNLDLLARADRIFVQTDLERRTLAAAGLEPDKLVPVGLGVDPAECVGGDRSAARRQWGIAAESLVVGHLANKSWDKGTLDLLDAAERLWTRGIRFDLLLAGPEMPSFTARWREFALHEHVVNLGVLSPRELRAFYAALDVFALPSYVESFGISPLEAGLNGAAVMAYDHGGPSEIFKDGITARLVPVGNIAALAEAIEQVLTHACERTRLGEAARRLAATYTWDRALARVRHAYGQLLGAGPPPRP